MRAVRYAQAARLGRRLTFGSLFLKLGLTMQGNPKVIAALNEALKEELTAINQYFLHARMHKNWGYYRLGERIYRVASLQLPPDEKPLSAADALAFDGVRFFVTRAEEAASFVLDDHNAATVVHIARRLDGIPLAIELATARLRAMTVEQLAIENVVDGGNIV